MRLEHKARPFANRPSQPGLSVQGPRERLGCHAFWSDGCGKKGLFSSESGSDSDFAETFLSQKITRELSGSYLVFLKASVAAMLPASKP